MSTPQSPQGVDLTESRSADIIGIVTALWVGASAILTLRLCARRKSKVGLGWDDWLVVFAWVPFSATCIANYVSVHFGNGKHLMVVIERNPGYPRHFLKYVYSVEILYLLVIGPAKCSICCLYIRIFGRNKPFRNVCLGLITISVLWATGLLLSTIFQCTPVQDAWNPTSDRHNCVNLRSFLVGWNVPNIVIDFMILITPIVPIWQLHLPTRKKTLITIILMLGAGEVAFSVVRLAKLLGLNTSDPTWNYFDATIWSAVEQSMGIICVCLPVLGPLLPRKTVDWINGSTDQSKKISPPQSDSSQALRSSERKKLGEIDNESVSEHGANRSDNIQKTTEFSVDYDDNSESNELNHAQRLGLAR